MSETTVPALHTHLRRDLNKVRVVLSGQHRLRLHLRWHTKKDKHTGIPVIHKVKMFFSSTSWTFSYVVLRSAFRYLTNFALLGNVVPVVVSSTATEATDQEI